MAGSVRLRPQAPGEVRAEENKNSRTRGLEKSRMVRCGTRREIVGSFLTPRLLNFCDDEDWKFAFKLFHTWLKPGGRIYVSDLAYFEVPEAQQIMWKRYGEYLESLGGKEYRSKVFDYIDKEDSPRSLPFQLDLLKSAGFSNYDILHRNSVFACYFGVK